MGDERIAGGSLKAQGNRSVRKNVFRNVEKNNGLRTGVTTTGEFVVFIY